jgi:GT2 family glycosyltransferase
MGPNAEIIVAFYNHSEYLAGLCKRVCQQSLPAKCLRIINDASSHAPEPQDIGRFGEAMSKARIALDWLDQTANMGPSAARNRGAKVSNAEFLIFVDADNLPRPNMIEVFLRTIEETQADLVVSPMRGFSKTNADGEPDDTLFVYTPDSKFDPIKSIQDNNLGDTNFCVRRSVFEALGGFREDRDLMGVEDWDFLIRFELAGYKRVVAPEVLIDYRVVPGSLSRRTNPMVRHRKLLDSYLAGSPAHVSQLVKEDWLRMHYEMKKPSFRLARRVQNALDGQPGAWLWFLWATLRRLNPWRG